MMMKMKATSWEANVARKLVTTPRASLPFPKQTSTLKDLEPDMDDDIIDITDYSDRPTNDKRSHRPKQTNTTHVTTQGHCPTPQNRPPIFGHECCSSSPCQAS